MTTTTANVNATATGSTTFSFCLLAHFVEITTNEAVSQKCPGVCQRELLRMVWTDFFLYAGAFSVAKLTVLKQGIDKYMDY